MRAIILMSLAGILAISACSQSTPSEVESTPAKKPEMPTFLNDIDATKADEILKQNPTTVVLDVRTPDEFNAGHLDGALNIDFTDSSFKDELSKLDRDQTYLLHCQSGGRSGKSKETFTELGFKHIYHLDGGFLAWEKAGLPIAK